MTFSFIKKFSILNLSALLLLCSVASAQEPLEHDELLKVSSYKISSLRLVRLNRRIGLEIGLAPVFQNNSDETILDLKADFTLENSNRLELTDSEVVVNALPRGEFVSTGDTISILIKRWPGFRRIRLEAAFDTMDVMGLDLDEDGIRDDLEEFVASALNGVAAEEVSTLVGTTNGVLSLDPSLPDAEQTALDLIMNGATALRCLGQSVGELEADLFYRTLLVEAYDTSVRIDQYLAFTDVMRGRSIRIEPMESLICPE